MYEVIVVWSCELLQQLSNVMIAGESRAPPPAADWTAHSRLGTINQEISLKRDTEFSFNKEMERKGKKENQIIKIVTMLNCIYLLSLVSVTGNEKTLTFLSIVTRLTIM